MRNRMLIAALLAAALVAHANCDDEIFYYDF